VTPDPWYLDRVRRSLTRRKARTGYLHIRHGDGPQGRNSTVERRHPDAVVMILRRRGLHGRKPKDEPNRREETR
jgi:hypothetical protein